MVLHASACMDFPSIHGSGMGPCMDLRFFTQVIYTAFSIYLADSSWYFKQLLHDGMSFLHEHLPFPAQRWPHRQTGAGYEAPSLLQRHSGGRVYKCSCTVNVRPTSL